MIKKLFNSKLSNTEKEELESENRSLSRLFNSHFEFIKIIKALELYNNLIVMNNAGIEQTTLDFTDEPDVIVNTGTGEKGKV